MTADLTAFLRACIDDDERLALAVENSVGTHRAGEMYDDGSGTATYDAFPSYPWGAEAPELPFMAGPGHPARVLADVQAKRAIIEHCTRTIANASWDPPGIDPYTVPAIAHVLRLLASAYSDHPDYSPGWKPDN